VTWRLGVAGTPVRHSLTPAMHRAALRALGLKGDSEFYECDDRDTAALVKLVHGVDGLSVTMPLKERVLELCDEIDADAQSIRSVNSLFVRHGRVLGRSTDGAGFIDGLAHDFDVPLAGATVLVRGSGGAARAVVDALANAGARVVVVARRRGAAERIAAEYSTVEAQPLRVSDVAVTVNAIPAAASRATRIPGVDPQVTYAPGAVAVDLNYVPESTGWLAGRADAGLRTANGLSMLVFQARRQMEWWFDRPVPAEPLFRAVGR
jgi:shikimate dehydrogenase